MARLMRLLHAGGFEVFEYHLPEILPAGLRLGELMDQAVVLIDSDDTMRREALHCERTGDADARIVDVGLLS